MKLDKDFNPGQGNTYVIMESGAIYNNNPNATTVTNTTNIFMDGKNTPSLPKDNTEKQIKKDAILEYVGKLKDYTYEGWKNKYDQLWLNILDIPQIDAEIYNKGQQKGTIFNRNLVGNILHVLLGKVFKETNVSNLTIALEGKSEASIRAQMGKSPSPEIETNLLKLIEDKYGR